MDRQEAIAILGLKFVFSAHYLIFSLSDVCPSSMDDVTLRTKLKDAHRHIMLSNRPDRGGSPYLASKINEAKNLLDKTNEKLREHFWCVGYWLCW
ncbi:hypothetical protein M405DRAFT_29393 [Rhizopogon salebrosus TDB-379]|nr:hypothetical protein M405DRAFT_29393 [Rhizopogon salebrosus TDB-379]